MTNEPGSQADARKNLVHRSLLIVGAMLALAGAIGLYSDQTVIARSYEILKVQFI